MNRFLPLESFITDEPCFAKVQSDQRDRHFRTKNIGGGLCVCCKRQRQQEKGKVIPHRLTAFVNILISQEHIIFSACLTTPSTIVISNTLLMMVTVVVIRDCTSGRS